MAVSIALFVAGVAMGLAGACMWAWAVHTGQFRDLEKVKDQLFWPEIADDAATDRGPRVDPPAEEKR